MSRILPAAFCTAALLTALLFGASLQDEAGRGAGATILPTPTPAGDPGAWFSAGELNYPRWGHIAVTTSDNKHLIVGGWAFDGGPLPVEQYDGEFGWTVLSGPARLGAVSTADPLPDGRVFVTGSSGAEIFDPAANTWLMAPPSIEREGHTASVLPDGRVLLVGGFVPGQIGVVRTRTAEIYDPDTNTWQRTADAATSHAHHTATVLDDGRVLVTPSFADTGHGASSAEIYDPLSDTWSAAGTALHREDGHAVKLSDGRVLVVGGIHVVAGFAVPAPPQVFDPATNEWSSAGDVFATEHTLTLMGDGRVLVTLGASQGEPSKEAFLYLPAGNGWAAAPQMDVARRRHAGALFEGRVVVTGGKLTYRAIGSAERYAPGPMPSPDPPTTTPTPTHTPTPGNSPTYTPTGFSTRDLDSDGFMGNIDNCRDVYNPGQQNMDNANASRGLPGADPTGDACDRDDDGDGCDDYYELRGSEMYGGLRSPSSYWDFFDVTRDRAIDLSDTLDVLAHFGEPPGTSTSASLRDRVSPDPAHPWRTAEGTDGVDLTDALVSLSSFGHECQ